MIVVSAEKFRMMFDVNVVSAEKSRTMFDVIPAEQGRNEYMFDVIGNEAWKYSPNARKFEAKADKFVEKSDVITIAPFTTERRAVKHAARLNLQTSIHVKHGLKQRTVPTKHVKLSRDLSSCSQKLPSFAKEHLSLSANID